MTYGQLVAKTHYHELKDINRSFLARASALT